jgi:recombination protein RecR
MMSSMEEERRKETGRQGGRAAAPHCHASEASAGPAGERQLSGDQRIALVDAIRDVKDRVTYCTICNNFTDVDPCQYCDDPARDHRLICVIEEPQNVNVIEKTGGFRGVYHVLLGSLSPLQGVGPDDLKIKGLLTRIASDDIEEIILATNPTVEGEATAIYLARLLKPLGVRVTRIATGIPVGSDLEYADELTMGKAMEGRREV